MSNDICHVLLIEDKLDNVELLENLFSAAQNCSLAQGLTFPVTCIPTLAEAIPSIKEQSFDVILLNLSLPDSQGFNTLIQLRTNFPNLPLIVETESQDESLVVRSFQLGADGYLQIKILDSNLLIYEIRLAIERQQYRGKIAQEEQKNRQNQEFADLDALVKSSSNTSITAKLFGNYPLQESLPDVFEELAQTYGNLLELAIEQRIFKVEYNLSEQLRTLGDKLGFLKASPRDAIEIHTKILKEKSQDVPVAKAQAYVAEGRLMIVELMGYLASFYRKYYIGLSNINISSKTDYP
ncbi:response regulator [Crocosphaera sp. UHCC 0190]|uniref:response regulator n=1 Tax=Crocosphaera sp. UHCC 0190 TaxID=3110246 RepID=UPI002B1EDC49|nr:response regulator [Crocosphaera sp. UHCC 0190]MEA5510176.1 response regulator [Crocosphaera sp. UHCC 0190]